MKANDTGAQIVDRRRNWEARVEMAIFKRPSNELSTYDKLVYAILCGHANRDGNAMLYVRTVAEEASCSERQTQRSLSNLETRGLLVRRPHNHNGRQSFNIYEIYGFEAYICNEPPAESSPKARPEDVATFVDPGVQDSHPCRSDTPRPSDRHPRGDSQAGLNNVFQQLLKNNLKNNNSPLTPPGGRGGEDGKFETQKLQNQKHDTETKGQNRNREAEPDISPLHEAILAAFNEILPELPGAEKLTASRFKTLNSRIGENPARKEADWWRKYFERVRLFPWLMGRNPSNWKATFDWLIGEGGMQKVIEGGFKRAPHTEHSREDLRELQRKYTNERGIVDAKALLRDWRASTLGKSGMA
jgi:hypothetical protein